MSDVIYLHIGSTLKSEPPPHQNDVYVFILHVELNDIMGLFSTLKVDLTFPLQFIFYTFILHVLLELNYILGHFSTFKRLNVQRLY